MKKLYVLFTFCLLLLCCFSAGAIAQNRPYVDGKAYQEPCMREKHTVRVADGVVYAYYPAAPDDSSPAHYEVLDFFATQELATTVKDIRIAGEIDGVPVTAVRRGVVYVNELSTYQNEIINWVNDESYPQVRSITLPESVTTLGTGAFRGLDGIKDYRVPDWITTLEGGVFSAMNKLQHVTLGKNVTDIGQEMFMDDKRLTSVTTEGTISRIGINAFRNCVKLQSFSFPKTPLVVETQAFANTGLTTVAIPGSTTFKHVSNYIEPAYFALCKKLTTVVFKARPKTETRFYIDDLMFYQCKNLKKVTLPDVSGLKNSGIMHDAFKGCVSLKSLKNEEAFRYIDKGAFMKCRALTSFTVSKNIKKIRQNAFTDCDSLKKLRVLATNPDFLNRYVAFLQPLQNRCKIYVKTAKMKTAFQTAGFKGSVIVKKDLA